MSLPPDLEPMFHCDNEPYSSKQPEPPEQSPTPPAPAIEPLSRPELKRVLEDYDETKRISPEALARFEATELNRRPRLHPALFSGITAGLYGSHVISEAIDDSPDHELPNIVELPSLADTALRVLSEDLPGDNAVTSNMLGDHVPSLLLAGSLGYAAFGVVGEVAHYVRRNTIRKRALEKRSEITDLRDNGMLRWHIAEGGCIAFVGEGDPIPDEIARSQSVCMIQIAYKPVKGPFVKLAREADHQETMEALDRADIANAGKLALFPTNRFDEFLPGEDDHDISLGRMVSYIRAADEKARREGTDPLPILIVGSKSMRESYGLVGGDLDMGEPVELRLEDRMERLADERGQWIRTIDPTKIVTDKLSVLAEGRPLKLAGTTHSLEMYAHRFFRATQDRSDVDEHLEPLIVHYNNNDFPTVDNTRPGEVAIIIDPTKEPDLIDRGIPREYIIVVPKEVLEVVKPLIEPPETTPRSVSPLHHQ